MKNCDSCFWRRETTGKKPYCKVMRDKSPMKKDNGAECAMYISNNGEDEIHGLDAEEGAGGQGPDD